VRRTRGALVASVAAPPLLQVRPSLGLSWGNLLFLVSTISLFDQVSRRFRWGCERGAAHVDGGLTSADTRGRVARASQLPGASFKLASSVVPRPRTPHSPIQFRSLFHIIARPEEVDYSKPTMEDATTGGRLRVLQAHLEPPSASSLGPVYAQMPIDGPTPLQKVHSYLKYAWEGKWLEVGPRRLRHLAVTT
jgi:hypothetical protein